MMTGPWYEKALRSHAVSPWTCPFTRTRTSRCTPTPGGAVHLMYRSEYHDMSPHARPPMLTSVSESMDSPRGTVVMMLCPLILTRQPPVAGHSCGMIVLTVSGPCSGGPRPQLSPGRAPLPLPSPPPPTQGDSHAGGGAPFGRRPSAVDCSEDEEVSFRVGVGWGGGCESRAALLGRAAAASGHAALWRTGREADHSAGSQQKERHHSTHYMAPRHTRSSLLTRRA